METKLCRGCQTHRPAAGFERLAKYEVCSRCAPVVKWNMNPSAKVKHGKATCEYRKVRATQRKVAAQHYKDGKLPAFMYT
jgi:uncharacterized protein with FMN-binding domain